MMKICIHYAICQCAKRKKCQVRLHTGTMTSRGGGRELVANVFKVMERFMPWRYGIVPCMKGNACAYAGKGGPWHIRGS